jgi:hypothetical protein
MKRISTDVHGHSPGGEAYSGEQGIAVLLALIALSLFSLLGLLMMLNSGTDLRISDNSESQIRASCGALAGLNHSRVLLRGLSFDQQLKGPDGTNDSSISYRAQAKAFGFRNPIPWAIARSLDILNPANDLIGIADDGLINSGYVAGTGGIPLIPLSGLAQMADNPYGFGKMVLSRYFVRVTDNNGAVSELAGDPADNPFYDGDGVVIVRSMGIAQTIREKLGSTRTNDSVVVFEARFKRRSTFSLPAPLVLQGSQVDTVFAGNDFNIDGGGQPGIGAIDTNPTDSYLPDQLLRTSAAGHGSIIGGGLPSPSIADVTGRIGGNPDQALLLNSAYLWTFAHSSTPGFADYVFRGDQHWSAASMPYIGSFDIAHPVHAPGQDPKVTLVDGNLSASGDIAGAGLLVVTGSFSCDDGFKYNGLVLVIGAGNVSFSGFNTGISGGLYIVQVTSAGGVTTFGTPAFSMSGSSYLRADANALSMAVGLIPVSQISFREVTSSMDP